MKIFLFVNLIIAFYCNTVFCSAPLMNIENNIIDMGYVSYRSEYTIDLRISNKGGPSLIISVSDHSPDIVLPSQEFTIGPASDELIRVMVYPYQKETLYIKLKTNDPLNPEYYIFFELMIRNTAFFLSDEIYEVNEFPGETNIHRTVIYCLEDNLEIRDILFSNHHIHHRIITPPLKGHRTGIRSIKEIWWSYTNDITPGLYEDKILIFTNHNNLTKKVRTIIKPLINLVPLSAHFRKDHSGRHNFQIHLIHRKRSFFRITDVEFDRSLFDVSITNTEDPHVKMLQISLKQTVEKPGIYFINLTLDEKLHSRIDIPVYID